MTVHAFTSCSYSYLNRARVLASTLRAQHPGWVIWLVMTDKAPEGFRFDLTQENYDRILNVEDLYGTETGRWLFSHDVVEACTAVKGRACVRILQEPDCEKLFYFDPDIAVFNPMTPVSDMLDSNSIVLTPHQIDPDPKDQPHAIRDNEITSLDYGIYNLGFAAISNDTEGRRFAQWWDDRLTDWCYDRLDIGLFVDQKWCNLVPCFFDGVKTLRDPGYNVASWNLSNRTMCYNNVGSALINGVPLRFYHFTKLGPVGDCMTARYARGNIEIYELWWWYRQQVIAATDPAIPTGWWHYGTFDSGETIPKSVRELYRDRKDLRIAFPAPYTTGPDSLLDWVQKNTDLMKYPQKEGFEPV
ncbi:hypothetical protein SAMN04487859_102252 [Roseovarius lutimaris]|uniref:Glycosyl transferase n=1 Tax=Roseovarius lutimaris TaxID=1005928 RepID=A0A1I4Z3D2_9RHOB|nr:hypothetical protein [Roseovarius lutimaris]SFN44573.1 hypothetical protein SAMN04487859_102252 [Roseovarius lutimaris]